MRLGGLRLLLLMLSSSSVVGLATYMKERAMDRFYAQEGEREGEGERG